MWEIPSFRKLICLTTSIGSVWHLMDLRLRFFLVQTNMCMKKMRLMTKAEKKMERTVIFMLASSKSSCFTEWFLLINSCRHCTGGSKTTTCARKDRNYDLGLRIGLIFPMLVASALGKLIDPFLESLKLTISSRLCPHDYEEAAQDAYISTCIYCH